MLNLKRKAIAIAILAIPAALASAQSNNPDDSDYRGPVVLDSAYQGKTTAAPSASSASRFRVVVNPEDSGYFGPVALDSAYQDKATAAPRASSASRFRVVVNPEDSGYFGPVEHSAASMLVIRR